MCLDFASGPAHVLTHLTSLSTVKEKGEEEYGEDAKNCICRNFYVDGGLTSLLST